jgi:hypothetical protein
MKNKLLLLAVVLLTTLSSRAVTNIEEGVNYYILNVETDLFLGAQNNWGTNGCISTDAGIFQFIQGSTGEGYNIVNTLVSVADKNLGTNLYTDNNGKATVIDDEEAGTTKSVDGIWSIEDQGGGIFAFHCTSEWAYTDGEWVETKHGYLARSENKGLKKGYNLEFSETLTDNCLFYVMTYDEALAYMVQKAQSNNVSFNFLIKNPDFCRNQSTADWTASADCTNKNLSGGTNDNRCAESWHSTFTISQVIKDLPAGRYQLSAQGFYRLDDPANDEKPVVFAGETEVALPLRTGSENDMSAASNSFAAGNYMIDPVRFELTEPVNDLEVGFRLRESKTTWVIFDNIQLMSYSDVPAYAKEILAGIKFPIEGVGSADAWTAYDNAYNDFKIWVEGLQQGDATFDEVDQRYADFALAEKAWKASVASWSSYVTVSDKAKKLYTQIASQEGKYKPAVSMNALNAYVNGAASAYGPGSTSGSYTFVNGCYNYIMQHRTMNDEQIAEEVAFVNGLMNDVKKDVVQPGMDVSFLLVNPDFTEAGGAGWNGVSGITDPHGGLSGWPCAEAYDKNSFDFYQIVENAPAGLYSISVNAFYRPSYNGSWTGEEKVPVEIYMGTVSSPIQHIAKDPVENDLVYDDNTGIWQGTIAKNGTNVLYWQSDPSDLWKYNENEDPAVQNVMANSTHIGGSHMTDYSWDDGSGTGKLVPNGMTGASVAFSAGRYPMTVYGEVPDEGDGVGTLRIGIRSTSAMHWALWSNFRLQLLGEDRNAMRAQLIEKVSAIEENPLLLEGSGLQEVFLNDTIAKRIPAYQALINNDMATYQDYKNAYDEAVYLIAKLDVYQTAINNFYTTQAELTELIANYDGDEKVKQFAQNVYDVFDLMSALETGSMISLTNEDMDNLLVYDEATYGSAPEILDREMMMDDSFDPSAAADGAYTSTYDFYNSVMEEIRLKMGSIYIKVQGTGTADDPEEVTDQLINPDYIEDTQWKGTECNAINTGAYGSGEWYQKIIDAYQPLFLPEGYYTFISWTMDRRNSWETAINGVEDEDIAYATYMYVKMQEADTIATPTANARYVAKQEDITDGAGGIPSDIVTGWYTPNTMDQFNAWMQARRDKELNIGGTRIQFYVPEGGAYTSIGFYRWQLSGTSWFICDQIQLFYATDGFPEPTGVSTLPAFVEKGKADGKYLENDRLVIYSNGKKFNAAGQIVK